MTQILYNINTNQDLDIAGINTNHDLDVAGITINLDLDIAGININHDLDIAGINKIIEKKSYCLVISISIPDLTLNVNFKPNKTL